MQTYERFKNAAWHEPLKERSITIIGAGGIGSWLCLFIARAGIRDIFLYEYDTVSLLNLGGQMFPTSHESLLKTKAVEDNISKFADRHGVINDMGKFEEGSVVSNIVITCADDMNIRKQAFDTWKNNGSRELFIDGRMAAESGEMFCITPENEDKYMDYWFPPEEANEQPCALKATTHCGSMLAGLITAAITNYFAYPRKVPFYKRFDLPLITFSNDPD